MTARKAWAAYVAKLGAAGIFSAEEVATETVAAVAERRRSAPEGVGKGSVGQPAPKAPQRSKYGAVRTADGYASKREAKRAAELRLLQKTGQIRGLREQVRFDLIPAQYEDGKCVERACSYVADFVYIEAKPGLEYGGLIALPRQVVEDAKGVRTPDYIIKRKLMLFLKKIRIMEV